MKGERVVLTDMLQCRERRAQIQDTFIEQYHCPVISFCMNIPGPVKTNEQIRAAFDSGKNTLLLKLEQAEADIKNSIEIHEKTGDELLLAIDCPAEKIKDLTTEIEEMLKKRRFKMLVCDYIVEQIDGDYAHLRRVDLPDEELKLVARALLPAEIVEGCKLHYELMQYTII